jgi:hypothetical protein
MWSPQFPCAVPEVSDADSQAGRSSNRKSLADGNKVSHMDRLFAPEMVGTIPLVIGLR